ncbi:MAG: HAMP domain-containing sensor histidine kinase, partial [Bacteriovoracaceae bacterium]
YIADVLVDSVSVGTPASYTFTNIAADHTIVAVFTSIPPVKITTTTIPVGITTTTIDDEKDSQGEDEDDQDDQDKDKNKNREIIGDKGDSTPGLLARIIDTVSYPSKLLVKGISETLDGLSEEVEGIIKRTPPPVAYSFPYLLFILLGIMTLNLWIQAKREIANTQKIMEFLDLEKNVAIEKDNFLMLSAHYFRTPMTLITGAIEEIERVSQVTQEIRRKLKKIAQNLSKTTEGILAKLKNNSYLAGITTPEMVEKRKASIYTSPYLILPVASIFILFVFANYLFETVAEININIINYVIEIITFVIVAQYFFLLFRKRQSERANRQYFETVLAQQIAIDNAKNNLIIQAYQSLQQDLAQLGQISSTGQEYKVLNQGYQRMAGIVDKFGLLANVKTGHRDKKEALEVSHLVEEILKEKEPQIINKKIKVQIKNLNVQIKESREKIMIVLDGIIDNAIKFNKDNGAITISTENKDNLKSIVVEDTGTGISKEEMVRLFKPFSRLNSALDFNYEGMGFSLFLAKIIMNSLGGDISIESTKGKATKVNILFG